MRYIIALFAVLLITGCATPSGKLTINDFNWTSTESKLNYQEAYLRMHSGLNSESAYLTEGNIYSDLGKGMIDVYMNVPPFGRSQYVLARVYVTKKASDSSLVEIGSNNAFTDNPDVRNRWLEYLKFPAKQ